MTAEEVFGYLNEKYGDEFNWHMLPISSKSFVEELKREISPEHFLYNESIWAVAKCDSNDDVLFAAENEEAQEGYYIFHLTYSSNITKGFPRYKKFMGIEAVKEYIEEMFRQEFRYNSHARQFM